MRFLRIAPARQLALFAGKSGPAAGHWDGLPERARGNRAVLEAPPAGVSFPSRWLGRSQVPSTYHAWGAVPKSWPGSTTSYLLDIAAQLDGEAAVLRLADPGSPTLIQDKEAKAALYVLMPMRV